VEEWLFNDAPRSLRIESIEKLPDLFDGLIKEAESATKQIRLRTAQAQQLANALNDIASYTPLRKTEL
jgi:hypothetical protein